MPRRRSVPLAAIVIMAWLIPAGILVQATLAGRGMFVGGSVFALHGGVGHGVLLIAVLLAIVLWTLGVHRGTAMLATLTMFGLVAQTGLGYAGRRSGIAAASAWHVPLGVALLGLSVAVALLTTQHLRTTTLTDRRPASSDEAG